MDGLSELAAQARERASWQEFARFCELIEKGLRADALKSLNAFVEQANGWRFEARLQFTLWVVDKWRQRLNLPQPLHTRLVVPTIREWVELHPQEAQAHLWLGLLGCDNPMLHVERALEIDPELEVARMTIVQWILSDIDYNQHHMPSFYIHDPRVDLERLARAELLLRESGAQKWAETAREEIPDLRRQAQEWLAAHPRDGDFASH